MSYKTKTGEEVTGETDEFLFYLKFCRSCEDVYDKTKFICLSLPVRGTGHRPHPLQEAT